MKPNYLDHGLFEFDLSSIRREGRQHVRQDRRRAQARKGERKRRRVNSLVL